MRTLTTRGGCLGVDEAFFPFAPARTKRSERHHIVRNQFVVGVSVGYERDARAPTESDLLHE